MKKKVCFQLNEDGHLETIACPSTRRSVTTVNSKSSMNGGSYADQYLQSLIGCACSNANRSNQLNSPQTAQRSSEQPLIINVESPPIPTPTPTPNEQQQEEPLIINFESGNSKRNSSNVNQAKQENPFLISVDLKSPVHPQQEEQQNEQNQEQQEQEQEQPLIINVDSKPNEQQNEEEEKDEPRIFNFDQYPSSPSICATPSRQQRCVDAAYGIASRLEENPNQIDQIHLLKRYLGELAKGVHDLEAKQESSKKEIQKLKCDNQNAQNQNCYLRNLVQEHVDCVQREVLG